MTPFEPSKAFQQVRAESQREREAAAEIARRTQEKWAAEGRRAVALRELMEVLPSDTVAGKAVIDRATALMIEYAQTLPLEWLKARVGFVSERLTKFAADGEPLRDAGLKVILLKLLLVARQGDHEKVAEIFTEARCGHPADMGAFWWCFMNWLVDKVVDGLPPLPVEMRQPVPEDAESQETSASPAVAPSATTEEEWLPASRAVEQAERGGYPINVKWLTQDAAKHGVRIRPRQLPGRHKQEVEWASLAGYLLKQPRPDNDSDEEQISQRIREAQQQKRQALSLD